MRATNFEIGKKYRRTSWGTVDAKSFLIPIFVFAISEILEVGCVVGRPRRICPYVFSYEDLVADDWEEYVEGRAKKAERRPEKTRSYLEDAIIEKIRDAMKGGAKYVPKTFFSNHSAAYKRLKKAEKTALLRRLVESGQIEAVYKNDDPRTGTVKGYRLPLELDDDAETKGRRDNNGKKTARRV